MQEQLGEIHHVPGRLRLKLPAIKHNDDGARRIERTVNALPGVRDACANTLTGSIVIRFYPRLTTGDLIIAALRADGYVPTSVTLPPPVFARSSAAMSERTASLAVAIAKKAVDALVERCAVAVIAALI
ncbi:HMA2 domain-containing protein [Cupriavidus sp. H39]|uniref:HMA2 domain-containing protein n=1 Tax=Cupriavidus sp. H39 TaxID=3401635 RepID=UPI003D0843D1